MSAKNLQSKSSKSALVAMSGGVDSTVAAVLAIRDGFACDGATMLLFDGGESTVETARFVADGLGISFHVFDFSECFSEYVIDMFISEYYAGRTPNPCVVCNRFLKFGRLLDKARDLGKDYIVTGHYVQVECDANERYLLKKGVDLSKDQSYALYTLSQEQLSQARFPLGGLTKAQVRDIAQETDLVNARKSESQDICFIPDGDYVGFIVKHTGKPLHKGRFVDVNGNDLGECKGVAAYTIGQRRGLGLAMPHPPYVLELHPADNTVVIGKKEMLYSKSLTAKNINLIAVDTLDTQIRAQVKIRYSDPGHTAAVRQTDDDTLYIEFEEPQRAITKGQSAVIYDGSIVVGGGVIA
ncbi:MAG: tRNA 2-thiouridine(34) synthase MnmA [Oscillospiraceae bacterium]|nr:tRNA 2-thiouridine(34) synthase MnmA [Oscillospiraceae bacterium]